MGGEGDAGLISSGALLRLDVVGKLDACGTSWDAGGEEGTSALPVRLLGVDANGVSVASQGWASELPCWS